jgi:hypothetical protein
VQINTGGTSSKRRGEAEKTWHELTESVAGWGRPQRSRGSGAKWSIDAPINKWRPGVHENERRPAPFGARRHQSRPAGPVVVGCATHKSSSAPHPHCHCHRPKNEAHHDVLKRPPHNRQRRRTTGRPRRRPPPLDHARTNARSTSTCRSARQGGGRKRARVLVESLERISCRTLRLALVEPQYPHWL